MRDKRYKREVVEKRLEEEIEMVEYCYENIKRLTEYIALPSGMVRLRLEQSRSMYRLLAVLHPQVVHSLRTW